MSIFLTRSTDDANRKGSDPTAFPSGCLRLNFEAVPSDSREPWPDKRLITVYTPVVSFGNQIDTFCRASIKPCQVVRNVIWKVQSPSVEVAAKSEHPTSCDSLLKQGAARDLYRPDGLVVVVPQPFFSSD